MKKRPEYAGMTVEAFDRKVAALRAIGVAPKELTRTAANPKRAKKYCTPLEWAQKLEYQKQRKQKPGIREADNAVVRAWKRRPEVNKELSRREKLRLKESPKALAAKRKNNRERMRRLRADPNYVEWWDAVDISERRDYFATYNREARRRDPVFLILCRLRARLASALSETRSKKHWSAAWTGLETVGELRFHMEQHFLPGMSWSNRDEWHVDHWMPLLCEEVDLNDAKHQRAVCHYSNLRPMWGEENLSKSNRVTREAKRNFFRLLKRFRNQT